MNSGCISLPIYRLSPALIEQLESVHEARVIPAPGAEVAGAHISLGRAPATDGIPEHFVQGVRTLLAALEET